MTFAFGIELIANSVCTKLFTTQLTNLLLRML